MGDQFWTTLRPTRKVGKLRGVIEIPAFSANCGIKASLGLNGNHSSVNLGNTQFVPTTAFTIRFRVKPTSTFTSGAILQSNSLQIYTTNLKLFVRIVTSATFIIENTTLLQPDTWYDVALVLENAVLKIYINSYLDTTSVTLGTGAIAAPTSNLFIGYGAFAGSLSAANIYLSGLECSILPQSAQTILEYAYIFPYAPGAVGLKFQFLLREYTGTTITNLVTGTTYNLAGTVGLDFPSWINDFPNRYLFYTSIIAGKFIIDTDGQPFSFRFPVLSPSITDDLNFVLCITGSDGLRYRLWNNENFIFAGTIADYRGQKIASGATLEVWNLDGNETVDLTVVTNLDTSILQVVTDPNDIIQDVEDAPVIDTELATEVYPIAFPMVFDEQQTYP